MSASREYGAGSFVAKMGAEAIQDLLKQVDLETEIAAQGRIEKQLLVKNESRPFVVWTFWCFLPLWQ